MGNEDSSSSSSTPSDLHTILETKKNVILFAVNTQIQGLLKQLAQSADGRGVK